jgi:hypothetical protein
MVINTKNILKIHSKVFLVPTQISKDNVEHMYTRIRDETTCLKNEKSHVKAREKSCQWHY